MQRKIRSAQQEVDKLAEKLKKEKEKYQKVSTAMVAVAHQIKVTIDNTLEACYVC